MTVVVQMPMAMGLTIAMMINGNGYDDRYGNGDNGGGGDDGGGGGGGTDADGNGVDDSNDDWVDTDGNGIDDRSEC
jgi:hypothetical protein